jgi:hypothetical protein
MTLYTHKSLNIEALTKKQFVEHNKGGEHYKVPVEHIHKFYVECGAVYVNTFTPECQIKHIDLLKLSVDESPFVENTSSGVHRFAGDSSCREFNIDVLLEDEPIPKKKKYHVIPNHSAIDVKFAHDSPFEFVLDKSEDVEKSLDDLKESHESTFEVDSRDNIDAKIASFFKVSV